MTDRNSRSAEVRENKTRRKPWQPPSSLDAPKPPPGYKYRWIRESILGQDDKTNMSKRIREGLEPKLTLSFKALRLRMENTQVLLGLAV